MFQGCRSLENINFSDKFDVSNVTNMTYMFENCNNLIFLDLSSWSTANLTNIYLMFNGCASLKKIDFRNATFSNVTNFGGAFNGLSSDIEIIVKDTEIEFFTTNFPSLSDNLTLIPSISS